MKSYWTERLRNWNLRWWNSNWLLLSCCRLSEEIDPLGEPAWFHWSWCGTSDFPLDFSAGSFSFLLNPFFCSGILLQWCQRPFSGYSILQQPEVLDLVREWTWPSWLMRRLKQDLRSRGISWSIKRISLRFSIIITNDGRWRHGVPTMLLSQQYLPTWPNFFILQEHFILWNLSSLVFLLFACFLWNVRVIYNCVHQRVIAFSLQMMDVWFGSIRASFNGYLLIVIYNYNFIM